jgi:hypothetical protein
MNDDDDGIDIDDFKDVRAPWEPPWPQDKLGRLRAIVDRKQCNVIEGELVDLFSASVMVKVHDALNEENRARFMSLPICKMAKVAFKLVE